MRTGGQRRAKINRGNGPPHSPTLSICAPMNGKVLRSVENSYFDLCVDIFTRADGSFGFEEYRRDPEDGASWYSLHRYSEQVFKSEEAALAQAGACVAWLKPNEA